MVSCAVNGLLRGEFLQLPFVAQAAKGGIVASVMAIGLHVLGFPYGKNVVTTAFTIIAIGGGVVTGLGVVVYSVMKIGNQFFGGTSSAILTNDRSVKVGKSIQYSIAVTSISFLDKDFEWYYKYFSKNTELSKADVKRQVLELLKNENLNLLVLGKLVIEAKKESIDKDEFRIQFFAIYDDKCE